MYFVYAIDSIRRNYIYIGLTDNANRRIEQHNNGRERTTRPYAPFQTILIESYPTRQEARKREKYLKSGSGKEFLKSLRKK
ncbi:MAG: GIY-YIG nuclease family protein [Candidatus Kerfeldbacteria bacterium]|nr:GIY-YIG nuclease family protein [Candidatus Kerfeldbacteria bacterium]